MYPPHRRRGVPRDRLPLMLLGMQVLRVGIENIPPTTLTTLGLLVGLHLDIFAPHFYTPAIGSSCLLPAAIVEGHQWHRLVVPLVLHASDWHLYYNCVSLVYKGRILEPRLGTERMSGLIVTLGLISTVIHTGVAFGLHLVGYSSEYHTCAVGFSGVLFALKVILQDSEPNTSATHVMGMFTVPTRLAYWAELLVIQLVAPHSSLLGHLSGILAGLLYTRGYLGSLFLNGQRPTLWTEEPWLRSSQDGVSPASYQPGRFTRVAAASGVRRRSTAAEDVRTQRLHRFGQRQQYAAT